MPPPAARTCCILDDSLPIIVGGGSNVLDPGALGRHKQSSEGTGIMYMTSFGFVDFGHVRDLVDLTYYIYNRIRSQCPTAIAPGTTSTAAITCGVQTTHGQATVRHARTATQMVQVARSIAFDDSIAYEVKTYTERTPGGHNSSFSPEDLVSNLLGTWVAGEAIRRMGTSGGGTFPREVDSVLGWLCRNHGAQNTAATLREFGRIRPRWIDGSPVFPNFLKRRNFAPIPWLVHGGTFRTGSHRLLGSLSSQRAHYQFRLNGSTITSANIEAHVQTTRTTALTEYGPGTDQP